ncbi:MAG: arginase/agmatinase/formimionoglutamate hydrolase arginase family-like protein [Solirubrobacterales bacterium]|nr:arginase/agmatinase/formimionoglutamate hydrolase arginase family-like protein [Solirubrobacterales bacterium]
MLTDDTDPVRAVEIASTRAWPATESAGHAGWLLRSTPGVDRARSNSAVTPPQGGGRVADLDDVTDWYDRRGLRPRIMVSPVERHPEIDAELDRRGWAVQWDVDLLVAPLAPLCDVPSGRGHEVHVATRADADWLHAWARCEGRSLEDVAAQARHVLAPLGTRAICARVGPPHAATGVGLGVVEGSWCGLFAMATVPEARRTGVASAVLRALASTAAERGAVAAYLQVTTTNTEARALYARHGFWRSHGYRTRVAPSPAS